MVFSFEYHHLDLQSALGLSFEVFFKVNYDINCLYMDMMDVNLFQR